MSVYTVKRITGTPDYKNLPVFEIKNFYKTDNYKPVTKGILILREDAGFEITMWSLEANPRAIYHNPNDLIHTDSCMEAFINFYPEMPELGYLNVEMNVNAASKVSFGTGRHTRNDVVKRNLPHPAVFAEKLEIDGSPAWRVKTIIKFELIQALYGRSDFSKGHSMRANFYKCGDHTDLPHWGTWSPIGGLDFHSPEYFGNLVID